MSCTLVKTVIVSDIYLQFIEKKHTIFAAHKFIGGKFMVEYCHGEPNVIFQKQFSQKSMCDFPVIGI